MNINHDFMWATLVHLGTNLWYEEDSDYKSDEVKIWKMPASPRLRFDSELWKKYITLLQKTGTNTIILDVADALKYKSHPEIAVEDAWTTDKMKTELNRLSSMGFEVIPKLNFSTCHDVWMKEYSRMVSTEKYYEVCRDLINETAQLFEPRYIHLGMDEENYELQKDYNYVVIRQKDLWWKDLCYLNNCVEENGARSIIFSDYARENPEEFIAKCPKSIVQCIWYYFNEYGDDIDELYKIRVRPFKQLSEAGFDILPTGSIEYHNDNLQKLVQYCYENTDRKRLIGFGQTTWEAVMPQWEDMLTEGAYSLQAARKWYESK